MGKVGGKPAAVLSRPSGSAVCVVGGYASLDLIGAGKETGRRCNGIMQSWSIASLALLDSVELSDFLHLSYTATVSRCAHGRRLISIEFSPYCPPPIPQVRHGQHGLLLLAPQPTMPTSLRVSPSLGGYRTLPRPLLSREEPCYTG